MIRNITGTLRAVLAATFDVTRAELIIGWLASEAADSVVDWDRGAGENWARVVAGSRVVAFVWVRGPLAIVVTPSESIVAGLGERGVMTIGTVDMETTCFASERDVVAALAGRTLSEAFDHNEFSAEDLVWATI